MSDFPSDTDRDIVDALVEHRVATVAQLSALLEVPERTIRYRLAQLRPRGYVRAVRPPADNGSAPDHWCPTRKADSWAKGNRSAQGGDRHAPSLTCYEGMSSESIHRR
jgi:predicted ArsR family transcriptional regulator